MKKIFMLLLCLVFLLPKNSYAAMLPQTDISVNSYIIDTKQTAFIENSTAYIPIRIICEALGYNVHWDSSNSAAIITKDSLKAVYYSQKNLLNVNSDSIIMTSKALNINGRIYVPIRSICNFIKSEITWDSELYVADIKTDTHINDMTCFKSYTKDDIYWMSRIIEAESGSEPMIGKIGVGNVILNRVASKEFPDNVKDVIFDNKYGVQFEPTINQTVYNKPSYESVCAAKRALNDENYAGDSLYFLNPRIASNFWIVNNREFYLSISNHDFYL